MSVYERNLLEFRELFVKPSEILYQRDIFSSWGKKLRSRP